MLQMNILNLPLLVAQTDQYNMSAEEAGLIALLFGALLIPFLILIAIHVIANWKIFEKAGQPGWAAIIPIYSWICDARRPGPSEMVGHLVSHPGC